MHKSSINIDVFLDANRMPEQITWSATDSRADAAQRAKAMFLAFWDGADKSALRIDLWTKDMMVDEMGDFYYQMFMTMADTLVRATKNEALSAEVKTFAASFQKQFAESMSDQKA